MANPSSGRRSLPFLLLLAALPAYSAQVVLEPVRLPAAALAAPMVGTRLGALTAPTLHLSLTPSLQTPTLTSYLVPQIQVSPLLGAPVAAPVAVAPMVAAPQLLDRFGRPIQSAPAASAIITGMTVQQALSQKNAQPSQVLSSFYEGSRRATPAVDLSPAESPAASGSGYLAETKNLSGSQLLTALHDISGRGFRSHSGEGNEEYRAASAYMFSVADNIVSHGVRGVVDAYSGIFVPGTSANGGDYSERGDQDGDGYPERDGMNVEHTWPQSFFGKSLPMRADLHHLLPTFQHPNSMRSNLPFGEVKGSGEYHNSGGAKEGGGVFEPPDVSKGKVARAVLYFYTRYYDRDITKGAYNHGFFKDRLEMFLRGNREHPPTADELRRNDLVEKYQGNRNPFTDDPALAERIGAEGFGGEPSGRGSVASPSRDSRPQPQTPERRHGRHHGGGNDRRFAAPGRLSALDFALH